MKKLLISIYLILLSVSTISFASYREGSDKPSVGFVGITDEAGNQTPNMQFTIHTNSQTIFVGNLDNFEFDPTDLERVETLIKMCSEEDYELLLSKLKSSAIGQIAICHACKNSYFIKHYNELAQCPAAQARLIEIIQSENESDILPLLFKLSDEHFANSFEFLLPKNWDLENRKKIIDRERLLFESNTSFRGFINKHIWFKEGVSEKAYEKLSFNYKKLSALEKRSEEINKNIKFLKSLRDEPEHSYLNDEEQLVKLANELERNPNLAASISKENHDYIAAANARFNERKRRLPSARERKEQKQSPESEGILPPKKNPSTIPEKKQPESEENAQSDSKESKKDPKTDKPDPKKIQDFFSQLEKNSEKEDSAATKKPKEEPPTQVKKTQQEKRPKPPTAAQDKGKKPAKNESPKNEFNQEAYDEFVEQNAAHQRARAEAIRKILSSLDPLEKEIYEKFWNEYPDDFPEWPIQKQMEAVRRFKEKLFEEANRRNPDEGYDEDNEKGADNDFEEEQDREAYEQFLEAHRLYQAKQAMKNLNQVDSDIARAKRYDWKNSKAQNFIRIHQKNIKKIEMLSNLRKQYCALFKQISQYKKLSSSEKETYSNFKKCVIREIGELQIEIVIAQQNYRRALGYTYDDPSYYKRFIENKKDIYDRLLQGAIQLINDYERELNNLKYEAQRAYQETLFKEYQKDLNRSFYLKRACEENALNEHQWKEYKKYQKIKEKNELEKVRLLKIQQEHERCHNIYAEYKKYPHTQNQNRLINYYTSCNHELLSDDTNICSCYGNTKKEFESLIAKEDEQEHEQEKVKEDKEIQNDRPNSKGKEKIEDDEEDDITKPNSEPSTSETKEQEKPSEEPSTGKETDTEKEKQKPIPPKFAPKTSSYWNQDRITNEQEIPCQVANENEQDEEIYFDEDREEITEDDEIPDDQGSSQQQLAQKQNLSNTENALIDDCIELLNNVDHHSLSETQIADIYFLYDCTKHDTTLASQIERKGFLRKIQALTSYLLVQNMNAHSKALGSNTELNLVKAAKTLDLVDQIDDLKKFNPLFSRLVKEKQDVKSCSEKLEELAENIKEIEKKGHYSISNLYASSRVFDIPEETLMSLTKKPSSLERNLLSNLGTLSRYETLLDNDHKSLIKNIANCAIDLKSVNPEAAQNFADCLNPNTITQFCLGVGAEAVKQTLNCAPTYIANRVVGKLAAKWLPHMVNLTAKSGALGVAVVSRLALPLQIGYALYNIYQDYHTLKNDIYGIADAISKGDAYAIGRTVTKFGWDLTTSILGLRDLFKTAKKQLNLHNSAHAVNNGAINGKARKSSVFFDGWCHENGIHADLYHDPLISPEAMKRRIRSVCVGYDNPEDVLETLKKMKDITATWHGKIIECKGDATVLGKLKNKFIKLLDIDHMLLFDLTLGGGKVRGVGGGHGYDLSKLEAAGLVEIRNKEYLGLGCYSVDAFICGERKPNSYGPWTCPKQYVEKVIESFEEVIKAEYKTKGSKLDLKLFTKTKEGIIFEIDIDANKNRISSAYVSRSEMKELLKKGEIT